MYSNGWSNFATNRDFSHGEPRIAPSGPTEVPRIAPAETSSAEKSAPAMGGGSLWIMVFLVGG